MARSEARIAKVAGLGGSREGVAPPAMKSGERCKLQPKGFLSRILNTDLSEQQDYEPRRFYFFLLSGRVVGPEVGPER